MSGTPPQSVMDDVEARSAEVGMIEFQGYPRSQEVLERSIEH